MIAGMIAGVIAGVDCRSDCGQSLSCHNIWQETATAAGGIAFFGGEPEAESHRITQNHRESKKNRWAVSNLWNELCGV